MKKVSIIIGVVVLLAISFGMYCRICGNPFWSKEEKYYNVAKLMAKHLAKYDGVKFAEKPTLVLYDDNRGLWRVGVTMTAKNGFGVASNIFVVVEFSANKQNPNFNKAEDWSLDGYAYDDEFFGSMTRFKEPEPTLDDIEVTGTAERLQEYGGRYTLAQIRNKAKKAARIVTVTVNYYDRSGNIVETDDAYAYGIAPGGETVVKTYFSDVYGAKSYRAVVKDAVYDK